MEGQGFATFLSRLLRWQVGARWYAVALLTAPLLVTATLFALSLASPVFLPGILTTSDKASLLLFGIAVGLGAGFFEELGWTGFAVPGLRRRYGVFTTGLIVGVLWGAWHFLVTLWGSGSSSGALSLALFLLVALLLLPAAYRVLMVWVYDRTESLLVAMLMHASLTASVLILGPLAISGVPLLTYDLVLAGGAVGRRRRARRGQPRAALATTAPEAGGLKGQRAASTSSAYGACCQGFFHSAG